MGFPKLKNPGICRIMPYIVVLGSGLLPIVVVIRLPVPDVIKLVVVFAALFALIGYMIKNFIVLMGMDMALALECSHHTARTQYTLPASCTAEGIRRRVLRYGAACEPRPIQPQPAALRYKFSSSMTVYASGIERVIAAYETDLLDNETYGQIFRSAKTNSAALIGRKKAIFLDAAQKKAPLHRGTVILILAHRVDPRLLSDLYKKVCQQCGDENENCFVPCVVDLEHRTCVFNSLRVPYVGFGYAVKNRCIRIIKRIVFGGNWNLAGNRHTLPGSLDPEQTLWTFWKTLHHEMVGADRETKRRFEAMSEKELFTQEDSLYLKWDHRGICQTIVPDAERRTVKVEKVTDWYYPKMQPIGKQIIQKMEEQIVAHYTNQGYRVEFVDLETLIEQEA